MKGLNGSLLFLILIVIVAFVFIGLSSAFSSFQGDVFNTSANGTQGYIPRFMNETFLNNSIIFQYNDKIGINNLVPTETLEVGGGARVQYLDAFQLGVRTSFLYPAGLDPEEPLRVGGYAFIDLQNITFLSWLPSCSGALQTDTQGLLFCGSISTGSSYNQSLNTSDSVLFNSVNASTFNTQNVTINNTGVYWLQGTSCKNRMFFNGTHMVFNGNC